MDGSSGQRPEPTPPASASGGGGSLPEAKELGLSPLLVGLLLAGIVALALAGLLYNVWLSDDASSDGLADTFRWFAWIGGTALSLALLGAGLTGRSASPGVRAAFLLFGTYLLVSTQVSGSAGVASLFSAMFGGMMGGF